MSKDKTVVSLVGTKYRGQKMVDLLASLPAGEPLVLKRDPDNEHDPYAVQVWARGHHIGFVSRMQARSVAEAMDAAAAGRVNVRSLDKPAKLTIDGSGWPMVEID